MNALQKKLHSLRACFQTGSEQQEGLTGVLLINPIWNHHRDQFLRFAIPDDDGIHRRFYAFTSEVEKLLITHHMGGPKVAEPAADRAWSIWEFWKRHAAEGVQLLATWNGTDITRNRRTSEWVFQMFRWARSLPPDDFRRVQWAELTAEQCQTGKARFAFMDHMPDTAAGLSLARIDDLWSKSVEFCDWLLEQSDKKSDSGKKMENFPRPMTTAATAIAKSIRAARARGERLSKKQAITNYIEEHPKGKKMRRRSRILTDNPQAWKTGQESDKKRTS